jgi:hypothetical protein
MLVRKILGIYQRLLKDFLGKPAIGFVGEKHEVNAVVASSHLALLILVPADAGSQANDRAIGTGAISPGN